MCEQRKKEKKKTTMLANMKCRSEKETLVRTAVAAVAGWVSMCRSRLRCSSDITVLIKERMGWKYRNEMVVFRELIILSFRNQRVKALKTQFPSGRR